MSSPDITLDTGALLGLEWKHKRVQALLDRARSGGRHIRIPAAALAQAWRADPRQHALRVLLAQDYVSVIPLDLGRAFAAGALCASTRTADVVDASVVVTAREFDDAVITSDPDDIRALDPSLLIFAV